MGGGGNRTHPLTRKYKSTKMVTAETTSLIVQDVIPEWSGCDEMRSTPPVTIRMSIKKTLTCSSGNSVHICMLENPPVFSTRIDKIIRKTKDVKTWVSDESSPKEYNFLGIFKLRSSKGVPHVTKQTVSEKVFCEKTVQMKEFQDKLIAYLTKKYPGVNIRMTDTLISKMDTTNEGDEITIEPRILGVDHLTYNDSWFDINWVKHVSPTTSKTMNAETQTTNHGKLD